MALVAVAVGGNSEQVETLVEPLLDFSNSHVGQLPCGEFDGQRQPVKVTANRAHECEFIVRNRGPGAFGPGAKQIGYGRVVASSPRA